jgi:hypothetical protein
MKSIPKKSANANDAAADKFANEDFQNEMYILASQALALGSVIEPCLREADREHVDRIADGDLKGDDLVQLAGMLLDKLHEMKRELQP